MPHDHSHHHHHHSHGGHHHEGRGGGDGLKIAFLLNLAFTLIEIAGGFWTNSIAILADAVHDLGDCLSLGITWYLFRLSSRGATASYTYGYRRFSVIGALVTGGTLLAGLGFVLWHAVPRLWAPEPVMAPGMMALAVLGVVMNGAAMLRTRKGTSLSERVVNWHLLEDTLGWIAVLVGAGVMAVWGWTIVDPIMSILISCFVLFNLWRNLREAFAVLLQRSPPGFDVEAFEQRVREMEGVQDLHNTHVWTLDGERHVLTMHVVMPRGTAREQIVKVKEEIRAALDPEVFAHVTVDVEIEGEMCVGGQGGGGCG